MTGPPERAPQTFAVVLWQHRSPCLTPCGLRGDASQDPGSGIAEQAVVPQHAKAHKRQNAVVVLIRSFIRRYLALLLLRELSISPAVGICFSCPPLLVALFAQSILDGRVGALAGPMPMRCGLAPTL